MDPRHAIQRLERLRELRGRRVPDRSAAPLFLRAQDQLARQARKNAGAAGAWAAVCPEELLDRTRIIGIRKGVLTIGVADASTRYELRNLLASGKERELIRRCPATVRRARLVSDPGVIDRQP